MKSNNYTVTAFDELCFDDVKVFTGTLNECIEYVKGDTDNTDYCIVAPDGFTAIEW